MTDLDTPEALAWAELQRRGSIRPRYLKDLKAEISEALARCLDPFIHEQAIRPYGVIICREEPHLEHLGRLIQVDGLPRDVIDSLADGRHAFVLAVTGQPLRLLLLRERVDTDQDYASRAVWIDGLILCSDEQGLVRIVTDSSITLVDGRRWINKDLVFEATEDIIQVVPAAKTEVVRRLLELCHHHISPGGIGATLLYLLTADEHVGRGRDAGVRLASLGISVLEPRDEPLVLHQARYRDGALLIGHDGRMLAANVILRPERPGEETVLTLRGTRHASAARHTADCPDVLAFVVSADGPVTVFSDGRRVADLKERAAPKTHEAIEALWRERSGVDIPSSVR